MQRRASQGHETPFRSPIRMLLEGLEGLCLLAAVVPTWPLAKHLLDDLGARPEELERTWPGDALLDSIEDVHTRAIDVGAAASRVWPWLHQFGLDRGGFFSYELLERLAGWKLKNVERLLPTLEPLELDDGVVLAPGEPSIWVSLLKQDRHLCFRTWRDERYLAERDPAVIASWSIHLLPQGADSCRLLLRSCRHERRTRSPLARALGWLLEDPLDFVMEQRMLRTIRRLAERE